MTTKYWGDTSPYPLGICTTVPPVSAALYAPNTAINIASYTIHKQNIKQYNYKIIDQNTNYYRKLNNGIFYFLSYSNNVKV